MLSLETMPKLWRQLLRSGQCKFWRQCLNFGDSCKDSGSVKYRNNALTLEKAIKITAV